MAPVSLPAKYVVRALSRVLDLTVLMADPSMPKEKTAGLMDRIREVARVAYVVGYNDGVQAERERYAQLHGET